MDFMHNTAYNHRQLGDLWSKEVRTREAQNVQRDKACTVYGTPRRSYRPVLGISGTLQATPNPCLEQDRHRERDEVGNKHKLPHLESQQLPTRTAEADLNYGVPPHQVHHHHFGWTLAGAKPVATSFSPRRPWGIGLQYANEVVPFHRQIKDCPRSPRARSPANRLERNTRPRLPQFGSNGDKAHQMSNGQFSFTSTTAGGPSDGGTSLDLES
mmetsp:Transcript_40918/g.73524  ORF Transcript_40918/g.73524 Transcript_40918/m.73524 type:complete len:213 (+) Transcript_40918:140-778(+)